MLVHEAGPPGPAAVRAARGRGLVAGVLAGSLVAAAPALAAWVESAQATSGFATATLAPASGLSAAASCVLTVRRVTLSWTATSSTFATGYRVMRRTGTGSFVEHATVSGRLTTSYVDAGLPAATTYTYYLQTLYGGWTASSAQVSATSPGTICL